MSALNTSDPMTWIIPGLLVLGLLSGWIAAGSLAGRLKRMGKSTASAMATVLGLAVLHPVFVCLMLVGASELDFDGQCSRISQEGDMGLVACTRQEHFTGQLFTSIGLWPLFALSTIILLGTALWRWRKNTPQ